MQRAVAFWSDGKKVRLAAEVVNALRRRLDGRMHERSLDAELVLLPSRDSEGVHSGQHADGASSFF